MQTSDLTPAMRQAVKRLANHGGDGVIDRYGRVIAAGEVLGKDAATWLRLMTFQVVLSGGPHRLVLSKIGWLMAEEIEDPATGEME